MTISTPFFVDYLTIRQVHDDGNLKIINGGRVVRIDADGEIEYMVDARQGLEGSFDSRVEVRCDGHQVEFSGTSLVMVALTIFLAILSKNLLNVLIHCFNHSIYHHSLPANSIGLQIKDGHIQVLAFHASI